MYPEHIVKPLKEELTSNGFSELKNDDDIKYKMWKDDLILSLLYCCHTSKKNE